MPDSDSSLSPLDFSGDPILFSGKAPPFPGTAGYSAPLWVQSEKPDDLALASELAGIVIDDPILLQKLSDRVFDLLQEELRDQQHRRRSYGGSF